MLSSIEAVIEKDGTVHLAEPVHPVQPMRAIVTLLEPVDPKSMAGTGHIDRVLELLHSTEFKNAAAGDPAAMEDVIQSNRSAWDD